MFPKKYHQHLQNIFDSTEETVDIIYKELSELKESSRVDFLLEFKKFFELNGAGRYYKEELIDKRNKSEFECDLSIKELTFAESIDHFTLELENPLDYYKFNNYPATDDWIEHKQNEVNNFFRDDFGILLKKLENHRELNPTIMSTNGDYFFPEELIDNSNPNIFKKISIASYQIEIPDEFDDFKNDLKDEIKKFEKYFGKASTEAFLRNSFKFKSSAIISPQLLKLKFNKERYGTKKRLELINNFRNSIKDKYGIKKKEFAGTLFLNFETFRTEVRNKDFNEDYHLLLLSKRFRKN
ncbi:hypothetical protein [Mesonia sp. K4-1]|uniref:hypothetical protein n=1 Tax=Mesonia sp. K4-1 TaxID=2602760 RepID=UPI0011C9447E|nr:hypothetical protein [Mesonia sp. K4-1]TXK78920.1 hypothetical protein FT986_03735 [Mesonia sp. K4-1]